MTCKDRVSLPIFQAAKANLTGLFHSQGYTTQIFLSQLYAPSCSASTLM